MAEIQKTNVCCLDLTNDCVDFLKSMGLDVYEGSLGSVYSIKWVHNLSSGRTVLLDVGTGGRVPVSQIKGVSNNQ